MTVRRQRNHVLVFACRGERQVIPELQLNRKRSTNNLLQLGLQGIYLRGERIASRLNKQLKDVVLLLP